MGHRREELMNEWLETNRTQAMKDYTAYLKAEVNVEGFVDADSLDNFWEWCMANQPKENR